MPDDSAYLDELKAKRRAIAGVKATTFDNQAMTFDADALDKEIARVEATIAEASGRPRMRFAVTSKGA